MAPPSPPWPEETGVWQTYDMHCHCGAIRWTMKVSPPLLEEESDGKGIYTTQECLCSHCERNGILSTHPKVANVDFTQGLDDRVEYLFATKSIPHWFCRHCGSQIGADVSKITTKFGGEARYLINARNLKGIPAEKLKREQRTHMRDAGPKYEV